MNIQDLALHAATGQIDPNQLETINTAINHGTILNDRTLSPVVDADGDRLIRDTIYLHRGDRIRITDWQFGSGNCMDTYYRVFFIDSQLNDRWFCVDASWVDGKRVYKSGLEKLCKERQQ